MQGNLHMGLISGLCISRYRHILCPIQYIHQILLDLFVLLVIQRIDANRLMEDLRKIRSDRRNRERDDGEAGLISRNVLVHDRHRLVGISDLQLFLFFTQSIGLWLVLRLKTILTKSLHYSRSCIRCCFCFAILICGAQYGKLTLLKGLIQINSLIVAVIVVKLHISRGAMVTNLTVRTHGHGPDCRTIKNHFQSHLLKLADRSADHALKAQLIADGNGLFLRKVTPHHLKALAVSFCVGRCHLLDGLLRQGIQIRSDLQLRIRNILTKAVQITQII